jgi:aspartate carbamoyltransferase catalytic subunit
MQEFPSVLEAIRDLSLEQVQYLLQSAQEFKKRSYLTSPAPMFRGRPVVATCFLEHSTRTKNSFVLAAEKLGALYLNFDPQTSSLQKGENLEETFWNLKAQGVNLCVVRTDVSGEMDTFKKNPPFKIINGGDGMHAHPTQALLDLYTMLECGFNPKNKTIAIIGDCMHSRVCHSLIEILTMFEANIILCGPSGCLPKDSPHSRVTLSPSLEETIKNSDLLYLLRVQKERHKKFGESQYFSDYPITHGVTWKRLKDMGRELPVYHPGPANVGVEIGLDLIKSPLYMGYNQVKYSIYMRMAIIYAMLGPDW